MFLSTLPLYIVKGGKETRILIMLKAIRLRLYPNNEQVVYINKLFGSYRFVYNQCLALKKNTYIDTKVNIGLKELGNYFHQVLTKNADYGWLGEHNTKVLKQSILNLVDAYKRFFVMNGVGFPKFKSKHDNHQSARFPIEAISRKNDYMSNRLSLTKQLKGIKFKTSDKYHRLLDEYKDGIRSATLSKTKSGKYFLSILIDAPETKQLPVTDNIIGIDLGIKDFVITSEGEVFDNIKIKRNNKKKLAKLHRELSRKVKGSSNREKARVKLARLYEKLNNTKDNYLHYVTNTLLNDNQVIVMENLNVSGMIKNHKLARSVQELSLYKFKTLLKYKAGWYGRDIVEIDRWFPSSKLCSTCGYKKTDLTLADRVWLCPECNSRHHRDINAAVNILNEGLRLLNKKTVPTRCGELTPLESSSYTLDELGRKSMYKNV